MSTPKKTKRKALVACADGQWCGAAWFLALVVHDQRHAKGAARAWLVHAPRQARSLARALLKGRPLKVVKAARPAPKGGSST